MSASASEINDPAKVHLWDRGHYGHDVIGTRTFGFWLYILSDAMIYAALFASYGVLSHVMNMAGGPMPGDVIRPGYAFGETLALFTSVLAYGYAMAALRQGRAGGVAGGLLGAMIFGAVFLGLAGKDIGDLFAQGITPERSGYLSIFFTLVIYHALHIVVGLFWMLVMLVQLAREGFTGNVVYRLVNLKLFWHFQAVVWVFVFVFVYLQGVIA